MNKKKHRLACIILNHNDSEATLMYYLRKHFFRLWVKSLNHATVKYL